MVDDIATQKHMAQNLAKLDRIIGLLEELLDCQKELLSLREEHVGIIKKITTPTPKKDIPKTAPAKKTAIKKPVVRKKK